MQPDQNVTAALSYTSSYSIYFCGILARDGAIFVQILDIFEIFAFFVI